MVCLANQRGDGSRKTLHASFLCPLWLSVLFVLRLGSLADIARLNELPTGAHHGLLPQLPATLCESGHNCDWMRLVRVDSTQQRCADYDSRTRCGF